VYMCSEISGNASSGGLVGIGFILLVWLLYVGFNALNVQMF